MSNRILFFYLFLFNYLLPQNTSLKYTVISNGAVDMQSSQTNLVGTIGQVFTSKSASNNTILSSGFWGSIAQLTLAADEMIPMEFSISSAYPNPFNPTINIDFSTPQKTDVYIQVFDLLGRSIFNHKQELNNAGKYKFQWNAMDNKGNNVSSGIYLVTIQHKKNIFKQKITFLK